ncbi:MAG: alpha/beta hydrolase [Salinivirgaceae bacterium]|nr:alpha/beta hydrolase [Salinivirgaceae bacterium]
MKILYKIPMLFVLIMSSVSCSSYKQIPQLTTMQELNYGFETSTIQLSNDINISYYDSKKGDKTIVFIHGLGSNMAAWKKNFSQLKADYRCIAIDLPGYGKSSKNPHSGLMSFYADVVMEFSEKMNLGKIILAGHSMGGQTAIVAALKYPEKIEKLILVDPAGFENFHAGQRLWFKEIMTPELVRLTKIDAIESNLASNFYEVPKDAQFMIDDRIAMRTAKDFDFYCLAVARSVAGMIDEPVSEKLNQIKTPTLIFFGEKDNLIPNRYLNPGKTIKIAEDGAGKIPNCELIMVPKCGHFMMFEKSDVFNTKVTEFLK